jgi:hypothetical protein
MLDNSILIILGHHLQNFTPLKFPVGIKNGSREKSLKRNKNKNKNKNKSKNKTGRKKERFTRHPV